jgi:hypothetical protein
MSSALLLRCCSALLLRCYALGCHLLIEQDVTVVHVVAVLLQVTRDTHSTQRQPSSVTCNAET